MLNQLRYVEEVGDWAAVIEDVSVQIELFKDGRQLGMLEFSGD